MPFDPRPSRYYGRYQALAIRHFRTSQSGSFIHAELIIAGTIDADRVHIGTAVIGSLRGDKIYAGTIRGNYIKGGTILSNYLEIAGTMVSKNLVLGSPIRLKLEAATHRIRVWDSVGSLRVELGSLT